MKRASDIVASGGLTPCIWRAILLLLALAAAASAESAATEKLAPAGPPAPSAQSPEKQTPPTTVSPETIPIGPGRAASSVVSTANTAPASPFNIWRLIGAMAFVLGAIFAVRWVGRRFLGLPSSRSSSGAIHVLCRSILSPRQQLMLVQVGKRIVLVADCGSQMNALCEIADPEEVAALAGQIQQNKRDSISSSFLPLLGRAASPYAPADPPQKQDQESAALAAGEDTPEPALAATREELTGLLEKVRVISRHFRRA